MDEVEDGRAESAVVVLCGLPASGKSTFVAQLTNHLQTSYKGFQVVALSFDAQYEILKRSPESFDLDAWHASRAECKATAKSLLEGSKAGSVRYRLFLIDDNMHLTSMRQEWFRLARDYRCSYVQLYFKCPLDLCRSRNSKRTGAARVKEEVLLRMASSFNEPAPDKHPWEQSTITIDTSVTNARDPRRLDQIWDTIFALWGSPPRIDFSPADREKSKIEGSLANASSLILTVDESSRKKLSSTMRTLTEKGVQGVELKQVGKDLNSERRAILDRCRLLGPDVSGSALAELEQSFSDVCDDAMRGR